MNKKKLTLKVFVIVALVQLYVPAKMILDREDVLSTGKEFKFITAPIDPNDPFRGKYITLLYKENMVKLQNENDWMRNETIYVFLSTDKNGYAKIHSISKTKPLANQDYVKAKVDYISTNDDKNLIIEYPFDKFYMEEKKAPAAEQAYIQSLRDTNKVTYGLVNIKDGEAVLKDVFINEISIREIVKEKTK